MSAPPPSRSAPPPPPPGDDEERGAKATERLLAAAKTDNEAMLEEALAELEDINGTDGMGNTALHYAVQNASTNVLETILCHDTCDVDIRNRNGDTPLHIAVRNRWEEHEGLRLYLLENLLEAGADTLIKNRYNEKPVDLVPPNPAPGSDDELVRKALRAAVAERAVASKGDIADDDDVFDPNDVASDSD